MPQTNTNEWEKEFVQICDAQGVPGAARNMLYALFSRHDKERTAKEIQKTAEAIEMSKAGWIEQGRQERTAEVVEVVKKELAGSVENNLPFDAEVNFEEDNYAAGKRAGIFAVQEDFLAAIEATLRSPEGEEEKTCPCLCHDLPEQATQSHQRNCCAEPNKSYD